jgi:hypothetical protein
MILYIFSSKNQEKIYTKYNSFFGGAFNFFLCHFLSADGYSDSFYPKFTTPKQNNLILDTSKVAQGLNPYVINKILDIEMYNYSFSISSSPYGIKY